MELLKLMLGILKTQWPKLLSTLKTLAENKSESIRVSPQQAPGKPSINSVSNLPYKHLTESETAKRLGIPNEPNEEQIKNLQQLNLKIYTPIKTGMDKLGKTFTTESGFRSFALNSHKEVGGSPTSDHMQGLALDLYHESVDFFYNFIKSLNLPFKQLIRYKNKNIVHVSLDLNSPPKREELFL
jgi:hypothetical protein